MVQVGREGVEGLLVVPHLGEKDSCSARGRGAGRLLASASQTRGPRVSLGLAGPKCCLRAMPVHS